MSPASGDISAVIFDVPEHDVSIQLMSPASGDIQFFILSGIVMYVSIQLMSPASGDLLVGVNAELVTTYRFHSINVPSEWGHQICH